MKQDTATEKTKSTPGVTDTAKTTSPHKAYEMTTRPSRAFEYRRDEEHAVCDGYRANNEPMQGV